MKRGVVDPDSIRDLFQAFGPVSVRRMFGGAGLYADGVMFGLVADGVIYLKTDDEIAGVFEQEGLEPFVYTAAGGKRAVMSYRRMPDRLYDDPDELKLWASRSLAAANRKAKSRPKASGRKRQIGKRPASSRQPKSTRRRLTAR